MPSKRTGREAAREVAGRWLRDVAAIDIQPVASDDSYSGAQLWKIAAEGRDYCLRRWPATAPPADRLEPIYSLREHLEAAHPQWIGAPRRLPDGNACCVAAGHLWEFAPWMPGAARPVEGCTTQVVATALATLAQLHQTAESFALGGCVTACVDRSPGLGHRRAEIERLLSGGLATLREAVARQADARLRHAVQAALVQLESALPLVAERFGAWGDPSLRLQWRIGDVRREHILFTGDAVTGVIDFGAACVDSPAGDVARLLGSMAGDDPTRWQAGLTAYEAIRPLTAAEQCAVGLFDAGGLCVAVSNWARWLSDEEQPRAASQGIQRLSHLTQRLAAVGR